MLGYIPLHHWIANALGKAIHLVLTVVIIFILSLLLLGIAAYDRDIRAPQWVKSQVQKQLSQRFANIPLTFESLSFSVNTRFEPTVSLHNVQTLNAPSLKATLPTIKIATAPQALLSTRQLKVSRVTLENLALEVIRNQSGQLNIGLNETGQSPQIETQSLPPSNLSSSISSALQLLEQHTSGTHLSHLSSIDATSVTITYNDLKTQKTWRLDDGNLTISRDPQALQARLSATLHQTNAPPSPMLLTATAKQRNESSLDNDLQIALELQNIVADDLASQVKALSWMSGITAPLSTSLRFHMDTQNEIQSIDATLQMHDGQVFEAFGRTLEVNHAKAYFSYQARTQRLAFSDITFDSPMAQFSASGTAHIEQSSSHDTPHLIGQFALNNLKIAPQDNLPSGLSVPSGQMDFRLKVAPFTLEVGQLYLALPDAPIYAKGLISYNSVPQSSGWTIHADLHTPQITQDTLYKVWPEHAVSKTRKWLKSNLNLGRIHNVSASMRRAPTQPFVFFARTEFAQTTLQFLKGFPAAQDASGVITFSPNEVNVLFEKGHFIPKAGAQIHVAGSTLHARPQAGKTTVLDINIPFKSNLPNTLTLLNHPPLKYIDKAKLPTDFAQGHTNTNINLKITLPLRKGENRITYNVTSTLTNVKTDHFTPQKPLRARALELEIRDDIISIFGNAFWNDLPLNGKWSHQLGKKEPSSLKAQVVLSKSSLKKLGVSLPQAKLFGNAPAELNLRFLPKGKTEFTLTSDLKGLQIKIPSLRWTKSKTTKASFFIKGLTSKKTGIVLQDVSLRAPGFDAKGQITLTRTNQLKHATLSHIKVEKWLNTAATLTRTQQGKFNIALTGGSIDLRRSSPQLKDNQPSNTKSPSPQQPFEMSLKNLHLTLTDTLFLSSVSAQLLSPHQQNRFGYSGEFSGHLNARAPVSGQLTPSKDGQRITLSAPNISPFFSALGLPQSITSGTVTATFTQTPRGIDYGVLEIHNIRVPNAPLPAKIIDAISVIGLFEQLDGNGLHFGHARTQFSVQNNILNLYSASATGSGLGLSLDGTYELSSQNVALSGVVSPIFFINRIGELFTRRGEGLFGAIITLTGPLNTPSFTINPLSLFTPAGLRGIFQSQPLQNSLHTP